MRICKSLRFQRPLVSVRSLLASRAPPFLVLGLGVAAVLACGEEELAGPSGVVAVVQVTPALDTLVALGSTLQLQAVAKDAGGRTISGRTFTWRSSNQGVATVSGAGLVTAVSTGTATISAETGGVSGSATTVVRQVVVALAVSPTPVALAVAESVQLSAAATDANGNAVSGASLSWRSSDDAVATVASDGQVTAVAPGTVTITAEVDGASDSGTVTVLTVELTRLRNLLEDPYVTVLLDHLAAASADELRAAFDAVRQGLGEGDDAAVQAALVTARGVLAAGDPADAVLLAILGLVVDHLEMLLQQHMNP